MLLVHKHNTVVSFLSIIMTPLGSICPIYGVVSLGEIGEICFRYSCCKNWHFIPLEFVAVCLDSASAHPVSVVVFF